MNAQNIIDQVESKPDAEKIINELMRKWYPEILLQNLKMLDQRTIMNHNFQNVHSK